MNNWVYKSWTATVVVLLAYAIMGWSALEPTPEPEYKVIACELQSKDVAHMDKHHIGVLRFNAGSGCDFRCLSYAETYDLFPNIVRVLTFTVYKDGRFDNPQGLKCVRNQDDLFGELFNAWQRMEK